MRKLILILFLLVFFNGAATAQQSNYPNSLDSRTTLITVTNNSSTTLAASITAGAAAPFNVTVTNTNTFPATGVFTVDGEIFFYDGKTSNTFHVIQRAFDGTAAAAHSLGALVESLVTAITHNLQSDAISATQQKLGIGASTPTLNKFLVGNTAAGSSIWRDLTASDVNTALGYAAGQGTVTSVGISVPAFLSVSGSPVTSSGTLAVTLSGTSLTVPVIDKG